MPLRWTYALAGFFGALTFATLIAAIVAAGYRLTGSAGFGVSLGLLFASAAAFGVAGYLRGREAEREREGR